MVSDNIMFVNPLKAQTGRVQSRPALSYEKSRLVAKGSHPSQEPYPVSRSRAYHRSYYSRGCPCGFYGDPIKACTCGQNAVHSYLAKISGPLLDRIDIHIEVPRLRQDELTSPPAGEKSAAIRARVEKARAVQRARFASEKDVAAPTLTHCNAHMNARQIRHFCDVSGDALALLRAAIDQMNLSARAYDRILKLSRTIADLAGEDQIGIAHIAEAVQYRALDRKFWG